MIMMTKIEKQIIKNREWLAVAAILFFVGAVFRIAANKWPEGIIYFIAAACFASLERTCCRKADGAEDNIEITDCEEESNE